MVKDRHLKYAAGGLALFALTQRGSDNGGSDPDNGNGDPDDGDGDDPDNGGGDPDTNQPPEGVYVSGQRNGDTMDVWEDSATDPDGNLVQWEWRLERTDTGGEPSVVDTSTGQNTELELAGTGDYRIVCVVTDNDGASAQDVWHFTYTDDGGSDPDDGDGDDPDNGGDNGCEHEHGAGAPCGPGQAFDASDCTCKNYSDVPAEPQ